MAQGDGRWNDEVSLWRWLTTSRYPPEALDALVQAVAEHRGRPPTKGLTPEEHRATGLRLQGVQAELYRLIFDLGMGYPLTDPVRVALASALHAVREACKRLDKCVDEEHGRDGPTEAYYGEKVRVRFDLLPHERPGPPPWCDESYDSEERDRMSSPPVPENVVSFPPRR